MGWVDKNRIKSYFPRKLVDNSEGTIDILS